MHTPTHPLTHSLCCCPSTLQPDACSWPLYISIVNPNTKTDSCPRHHPSDNPPPIFLLELVGISWESITSPYSTVQYGILHRYQQSESATPPPPISQPLSAPTSSHGRHHKRLPKTTIGPCRNAQSSSNSPALEVLIHCRPTKNQLDWRSARLLVTRTILGLILTDWSQIVTLRNLSTAPLLLFPPSALFYKQASSSSLILYQSHNVRLT